MASANKNNQGLADLEAHAIKTSGGIMPKIVSEAKKKRKYKFRGISDYHLIQQVIKVQNEKLQS